MSVTSLTPAPSSAHEPENTGPVKIVMERLPRRGAEERFRAWAEQFVAQASRAPGHEGGSVLSGRGGPHVILLRFASAAALEAWQRSAVYEALMRDADAISTAGDESQIQSGLETWFTLPDRPAPVKPPPKWKMALVTWFALLPMVIALAYVFAPLRLPFLLNAAVSTAIPVVMLTWVIMPRVTRVLYGWLYRQVET
jgi:antibiotic biosynthesis monooxygenase (ABM) superfamily enzyme